MVTVRAERFLHCPFFRVHVSFIIKIRGSGTGPGYPPGRVFCVAMAGNSRYMTSEGILRVFWPFFGSLFSANFRSQYLGNGFSDLLKNSCAKSPHCTVGRQADLGSFWPKL